MLFFQHLFPLVKNFFASFRVDILHRVFQFFKDIPLRVAVGILPHILDYLLHGVHVQILHGFLHFPKEH